ncbi:MAG TPA: hypothetical protein DEO92_00085 [Phycisphaerales bacterium]|nr:hypothetical protein [Phycisphaerales bacterium]
MSQNWFETHRETLDGAIAACEARGYWSAYPEVPSGRIYGEDAKKDGMAAWKSRFGNNFAIDQPGITGWVDTERSSCGFKTDITYLINSAGSAPRSSGVLLAAGRLRFVASRILVEESVV